MRRWSSRSKLQSFRLQWVGGLGVVAALLGCSRDRPPGAESTVASATPSATRPPSASASSAAPVPARYLITEHELGSATRALRRAVGGPVRALELRVFPTRLVLQAQDPLHPATVRQWVYEDGEVLDPVRVQLQGEGHLEDNLFSLDDVQIAELPGLIEAAVRRVDEKHGRFDYALVRRALPARRNIRIRLYIESPVRDGHVDATARGRLLHVGAL